LHIPPHFFATFFRREFEANSIEYGQDIIERCCSLIEQFGISVSDLIEKLEAQMIAVYSRVKVNVVTSLHVEAVKEQLQSAQKPIRCTTDSSNGSVMTALDVVRSKLTPQQLAVVQYSSLRPLAVIAGAGKFMIISHVPPLIIYTCQDRGRL
jgi:hypothetical protein